MLFDAYIREDVPRAAQSVMELGRTDCLFVVGHSMGGMIAYSVAGAALRRSVRGVVSIGTPFHFGVGSRTMQGFSLLVNAIRSTGVLDSNPTIPVKFVGSHLRKRRAIWDSRLLPIPIRAWFPGSVEHEILDEYLGRAFDRSSLEVAYGILRFGDRGVMLSPDGSIDYRMAFTGLDRPLLVIAGSHDHMAPPASVRPAFDASRAKDKSYRVFPFGHIDLVMGRQAPATVWPTIATWLAQR
jgi:pimeloyl-ACP methyl ester carboxylesterase